MRKPRHIPQRKCVACGQKAPKRHLTRLVRTDSGQVQADATGKASGRGAYLCGSFNCWEKGIRKGGLERGLQVSIPNQDREVLMDYYRQRIMGITASEK